MDLARVRDGAAIFVVSVLAGQISEARSEVIH